MPLTVDKANPLPNSSAQTPQGDPWRDRSKMMRCKTCMYFVRKERDRADHTPINPNGWLGRCRRNAPTMGGWPAVFEADWCGSHKLDENKI